MKKKYYSYYLNETTFGIVDTWEMCQEICKGVKGAKYKSFEKKMDAEKWLKGDYEEVKKIKKYYAVYYVETELSKIYDDWNLCQKSVKNKKVRYKGFKTYNEAEKWLEHGAEYEDINKIKENLSEGIYFDAGTGRGIGVEVRVTDRKGISLVEKIVPKEKVNEFGNYLCKEGSTNNYGELMGIYIALKLALKTDVKNIFGDSKLILEYWSKGIGKLGSLDEGTVELIKLVKELRVTYEQKGGKVFYISGDYNPADLGFHR